jgi:hypothetical protein
MKRSIEIYALFVCFFTLIWFAVSLGLVINQAVRIAFPQLTTPISNYYNPANPPAPKGNTSTQGKTNDQMQTAWEASYKMSIQQEKHDAIRNMIREFISLIISALIFIPHWKLVKREKLN